MFKSFSLSKNSAVVLVTLTVLILLGACYFFIYIPNNEKTVQERRFLCLQNIDNNIHTKIDNSISMLNNLLSAYPVDTPRQGKADKKYQELHTYISKYPKTNFTLLPIERSATLPRNISYANTDSLVVIKKDSDSQLFSLYVDKEVAGNNITRKPDWLSIGMRFQFDQFIKPLLTTDVFDNYIVFLSDRKTYSKDAKGTKYKTSDKLVYQSFPSGLSYRVKDSLLTEKNGITSPGIRSLNVGGTDYKVFSQPIGLYDNYELVVIGFLSNKNYQAERNQLPLWFILLLLTAALGMIVALPWIKLYHMGNKDKLTIADGVASVLVSMLLMAFLFFVIFKYSLYLNQSYNQSSPSSVSLANKITKAFRNELTYAYQSLSEFDAVYNNSGIDIKNLGERHSQYKLHYDTLTSNNRFVKEYDANLRKIVGDLKVDQVYWLDKTGQEVSNWSSANDLYTPRSNLGSREYFKRVLNNNPYKIKDQEFYLDQVVSRTNGVFTSVIAKKARPGRAAVVAMSFTAKSLDNVIMPDGYQFAIIDTSGKVLYHSIKERSLNENLKKQFADSSKLVSSIQAKSDTGFTAEYYGRLYNIKIKPFAHLPYFTVIFEDREYDDTRDTEAYAFTVSMLACFLLFLILQFMLVVFVSSKRSFFKKQLFETSWIGPKIASHHQYNQAIMGNLIVIILLIIFSRHSSLLTYLYILLFSITFIAIYLNCIFALKYTDTNPYKGHFKRIAIQWLSMVIVIIDYAAFKTINLPNFLYLLLFEVLAMILCSISYNISTGLLAITRYLVTGIKEKYKLGDSNHWTYTRSFAMMATTRLIVTNGIPVAFFFIYSFNYEQNLDTRYRQLVFARNLTQMVAREDIKCLTNADNLREYISNAKGIYPDGRLIDTIMVSNLKTLDTVKSTKEDTYTAMVVSAMRLLKSTLALRSDNMVIPSIYREAYFNNLAYEHIDGKYFTFTQYITNDDQDKLDKNTSVLKLSSKSNNYPALTSLFWILLLVALVGFYYIIHNIIRKLFALNLPSTDMWKKMDEQLLMNNKLNSLLLIVGPPGSGKLGKLKHRLNLGVMKGNDGLPLIYNESAPSTNNVYIADMIRIPAANQGEEADVDWKQCSCDALGDSNSLVIINHFEYNIKDSDTNRMKLDFLEALMLKGTSKVIIISTVHPLTFLDSFADQQGNTTIGVKPAASGDKQSADTAATAPVSNGIPESELERWHVLLGHFRIVIEPLEHKPVKEEDVLRRTIKEETQYTHFLYKMQKSTLLDFDENPDTEAVGTVGDSLIFKLQITSHYFYTYIWQSLTKEEKFLLYDLAEDGLVNPYDDYNLSMLISKGLIINTSGTLVLFNKGFRNFILTAIGTTEVNRIKNQVKDTGNWGSLRVPLNLAILAILVFLIVSQQEAYTRIITYITAIGAGVPAVLKIFSMMGNTGSTQKTN